MTDVLTIMLRFLPLNSTPKRKCFAGHAKTSYPLFKFGSHDDVGNAMASGFSIVDVDTWLDVIPQIIARIQTPSANIRRNIDMLLTDVGKHHPQALIYPLTVASQSSSISRKNAALAIMDRMRDHSATIVEQVRTGV